MRPRWEKVSSHRVYERIDQPKWRCTLSIQTYPHRRRRRRRRRRKTNSTEIEEAEEEEEELRFIEGGCQMGNNSTEYVDITKVLLFVDWPWAWPAGKNNNNKKRAFVFF